MELLLSSFCEPLSPLEFELLPPLDSSYYRSPDSYLLIGGDIDGLGFPLPRFSPPTLIYTILFPASCTKAP